MKEEIPIGLQKAQLKHMKELNDILPKNYFVGIVDTGWAIRKWCGILKLDRRTVAWVWWHSKEIEVKDKELLEVLREFGNKNNFKKLINKT